ncbi:alpha-L-rhamnosidase C-terminal domain-containing protein [Subtercola frigoramans]|uniref:alpha-L-rhamnosidase C-terminal domain-containing protein n=1 Tax=Subtercola frigoramans TaxID=120298 RepID=UPI0023BAC65F|nr:alpha-L-rhamnosidase C-terminal domain-containing protein [Subtercola frigoramans]
MQRTRPSWLALLDEGATSMWERWEGWDADGLPYESHNDFSKGAVITFLHRHVAGIRPVVDGTGYRRFEISPSLGGGLSSAKGRLETPHGEIISSWTLAGGIFRIRIVVPAGTTYKLTMPDG